MFILHEISGDTAPDGANDAIAIITLNNPEKRNALSAGLIEELLAALDASRRQSVRAVILRAGEGSKVWSAGHDVKELPPGRRDPLGYDDPLERLLRAVEEFPAPVIAMIQGSVWGGACDLVLTCDLVVADDSATFAITPVKLGVPYNATGILHFINRLGLNTAREMFFTAEPISATRAEQVGLLNYRVPSEQLNQFTLDLAKRMTRNSALAIAVIKEQIRILTDAHPISPSTFERIQGLRRHIYDSDDYAEGICAFKEKRPAKFKDRVGGGAEPPFPPGR